MAWVGKTRRDRGRIWQDEMGKEFGLRNEWITLNLGFNRYRRRALRLASKLALRLLLRLAYFYQRREGEWMAEFINGGINYHCYNTTLLLLTIYVLERA